MPPLGQRFDVQKAIEAVLYIANRVEDPTFHRVSKLLYFADQYHLANYGAFICGDEYVAMKHGPVPSCTYDLLKAVRRGKDVGLEKGGRQAFEVVDGFRVKPLRKPNLEFLAKSDRKALDSAIANYGNLSFNDLTNVSHDDAWKSADDTDFISVEAIARAIPDSDDLVAYVRNPFADA